MDPKAAATIAAQAPLLRRVARGGHDGSAALQALMALYEKRVLRYLTWAYPFGEADAEEVLNDSFLRLWDHAANYREGSDPEPWIWTMVRSVALDLLKSRWNREQAQTVRDAEQLDQLAANEPAATPGAVDECVDLGLQRFERIEPDGARALRLRELHDWGIPQLSAFTERSEAATRTWLKELRKKARPYIKRCLELLAN